MSYLIKNISEISRELGITAPQFYTWKKEFEEFGEGSFPGKVNFKLTPEQEKIHELEKRLKDAELKLRKKVLIKLINDNKKQLFKNRFNTII